MSRHHVVVAPIEKVQELILKEYPLFYSYDDETKKRVVSEFVKPIHQEIMYTHMMVRKDFTA